MKIKKTTFLKNAILYTNTRYVTKRPNGLISVMVVSSPDLQHASIDQKMFVTSTFTKTAFKPNIPPTKLTNLWKNINFITTPARHAMQINTAWCAGWIYECSMHGKNPHDLHPTCANKNFEMNWDGLKLEFRDKVESKCLHCDQRYPAEECVGFTGWKWVSEERYYGFPFCFSGRKICFHLKCMNEIMAPKEEKIDEYEMYHKCSIE